MRMLLVEDDEQLGRALQAALKQEHYTVDWLTDGENADQAIRNEEFDAVLLDINLPRRSGFEILTNMRRRRIETPVMIFTARDAVEDRVKGLDIGADDYLPKPFELDELLARLRALIRRSSGRADPIITHGPLMLNPVSHEITLNGDALNISPREFTLLQKLLENIGRVLSREQLAQSLYGWSKDIDSNTVEVHIHNLRKKLGGDIIRTVRGVGYMISKTQ